MSLLAFYQIINVYKAKENYFKNVITVSAIHNLIIEHEI